MFLKKPEVHTIFRICFRDCGSIVYQCYFICLKFVIQVFWICFSWNFRTFIHFLSLFYYKSWPEKIHVLMYLRNRSKINGKDGSWRSFGFVLDSITLMHTSIHVFCKGPDSKALSALWTSLNIAFVVWSQLLAIHK